MRNTLQTQLFATPKLFRSPFFLIICLLPFNLWAQLKDASKYHSTATGFYENKGQITDQNHAPNPAVKYLFCSPGFNVQLRQTGFSYDTYTDTPDDTAEATKPALQFPGVKSKAMSKKFTRHYHRVDIELQGGNPNASITADGKSAAYYNYFTARTPTGGTSDVHYYQHVTYKNIYPNIDLDFFVVTKSEDEKGTGVEYNFTVHPGGNPADIKLVYQGANKVSLTGNTLTINVTAGDFTEKIPHSYFKDTKLPVNVNYTAFGNNVFGFALPSHLGALRSDLVIDPTPNLTWGTYYGGTGGNYAYGVALDASKNVYITGLTQSTSGIATAGAYQTTNISTNDAFVSKFNPSGSVLLWGTYYGDPGFGGSTTGYGIALDASNNVYITGWTTAIGIATAGAYQTTLVGDEDAFVAKFNPTGSALLWGTYYGGNEGAQSNGIALDASDNVYITGLTASTIGIATAGAYQTTFVGTGDDDDAFVAKFNSTGSALLWGTYYGGPSNTLGTFGYGIASDASNNVYITGYTTCTSGIATAGAYQTTFVGTNNLDAFVAKFNPNGSALLWGTYYGGSAGNGLGTEALGIALDAGSNVYITGLTFCTSDIATVGAYQTTLGGGQDAFVAKFNPTGSALLWGTYYGGPGGGVSRTGGPPGTEGWSIALDTSNNVYITGGTNCTSGIATSGAYQTINSDTVNGDAFVAKFNPTGSALLWGTYYGGASNNLVGTFGYGIAIDTSDNAYIVGYTNDTTGIATAGAYQTTIVGSQNAFVAKFGSCNLSAVSPITGPTTVCIGPAIALADTAQGGLWSSSNSSIATVGSLGLVTGVAAGNDTITYSVTNTCGTNSAMYPVTVKALPTANITPVGSTTFCRGDSVALMASTGDSYLWSSNATVQSIHVTQGGSYTVTVTNGSGCSAVSTATTITVDTLPIATITPHGPTVFCQGLNVSLIASTGTAYLWSNGATTQFISATQAGNYTVTVTNANNCSATSTETTVTVYQRAASQFSRNICTGQTYLFNNQNLNQTGAYNDTLQTIHGCDSIVTLNLNVNSALQTSIADTTCNGEPYMFNGNNLIYTGSYRDTLQATGGCDSIVTLNLTVNNGVQTALNDTACNGTVIRFKGQGLTTAGVYKDTLQTVLGCDSVVTLTLLFDSLPQPTVTQSGDTLQTQVFSTYQWSRNGFDLNDGTAQTIIIQQNGNYSVVVTGPNGCSDTSEVLNVTTLGVQDVTSAYGVKLYPNPNTGSFILEFTDDVVRDVEITDAIGITEMAATKVSRQRNFNLEVLSNGIYFLRINQRGQVYSLKFTLVR